MDNPKQENGIIKRLEAEVKATAKERDEWKAKYEQLVTVLESKGAMIVQNGMLFPPSWKIE